jgi:hypothetical protein
MHANSDHAFDILKYNFTKKLLIVQCTCYIYVGSIYELLWYQNLNF